jgi:hypothetical protein
MDQNARRFAKFCRLRPCRSAFTCEHSAHVPRENERNGIPGDTNARSNPTIGTKSCALPARRWHLVWLYK